MSALHEKNFSKQEKTMIISILLSAPGPIITWSSALSSHSATQIADSLRRTSELVAMIISWWIYRKIRSNVEVDDIYRVHLERIANYAVVGAMLCSGLVMLSVGVSRLFISEESGNVILGLIIAFLGLLTNTWFWLRYRGLTREDFDPVIDAQYKLYRGKACVDFCVVIALTSISIASNHPLTQYIDAFGCIIVAIYLVYNGVNMIKENYL